MVSPYDASLLLYNITLIPIIFFSFIFLLFALISLIIGNEEEEVKSPHLSKVPFVSVQIPVYNDDCANKCVEMCEEFDYPKDRYEIIIVDDSTNRKIAGMLKGYAERNPALVKYIHRDNRDGFKPGALKNAMSITKGELIAIFDSDWRPEKNFLRRIVKPFIEDDRVAIVQAKQGIVNLNTNLISRFAGYLLIILHEVFMPIHNRANTVFFCGTGGAIRRDAIEKAGGWNTGSITEDADLSVKILLKGYKSVYVNMPIPSEVPVTFEGFIKQQMRWCYGLTRVFFDNIKGIFSRKLSNKQRTMIMFSTLGNITAPLVLLMTIFGMLGWFMGAPTLFKWGDIITFLSKFLYTSGFLALGILALYRRKQMKDFSYLLLASFSVSLVLLAFNSFAFIRATINKPLFWYRTPKAGNKVART